jgi:hypothetical protein
MFGARFAVFVRRVRVLPGPCHATRNLLFLEVSPAPSPCCFNSLFHWDGTDWCKDSTRWKSCKRLCDGRAYCPARAMQLVICCFLRFHRHRHPVVSTRSSLGWYGLVQRFHKMEIVQNGTNKRLRCMCMFGARFAVFVRQARVLPGPCPATRNLLFLEVSPAPSPCCFKLLFDWESTGWCENSTRWKTCKQVQARGYGA